MKEQKKQQEKIIWIECLRIFSAFAIVLLHVASTRVKTTAVLYEDYYIWLSAYHTVTRFAVNCFVMLSGALLLRPEKEVTVPTVFKKYLSRTAILFLSWSVVYVIATYLPDYLAGKQISFRAVCEKLVYGHYHLWYLYMLAGLYLITPLLKEIVKNKKLVEYFLILGIIFYLLPSMLQILVPSLYTVIQTVINSKMIMQFVKGYVVYYLLGYYLTNFEVKKWIKYVFYIGGLAGIVYGVIGGIRFSRLEGATTQLPYNNGTLNIFLYSGAVFLFFCSVVGKKSYSEKKNKVIKWLGSCSLGVYLLHPLLVDRITVPILEALEYRYLAVMLPLIAIGIAIVCVLVTTVLKKIPLVGKYIV